MTFCFYVKSFKCRHIFIRIYYELFSEPRNNIYCWLPVFLYFANGCLFLLSQRTSLSLSATGRFVCI